MSLTLGRKAKNLTPYQKETLMKRLKAMTTLKKEEKCELAVLLNITQRRVADWFRHVHAMDVGEKYPRERE